MKESQDSLHTAKHVRFAIDDVYRGFIALSVYSRSFVATRHLNREENERQRETLKENVSCSHVHRCSSTLNLNKRVFDLCARVRFHVNWSFARCA